LQRCSGLFRFSGEGRIDEGRAMCGGHGGTVDGRLASELQSLRDSAPWRSMRSRAHCCGHRHCRTPAGPWGLGVPPCVERRPPDSLNTWECIVHALRSRTARTGSWLEQRGSSGKGQPGSIRTLRRPPVSHPSLRRSACIKADRSASHSLPWRRMTFLLGRRPQSCRSSFWTSACVPQS
jgi:hypothetical protein